MLINRSLVALLCCIMPHMQICVICIGQPSVQNSFHNTAVDRVPAAVVGTESLLGYYSFDSASIVGNWLNFSMLANSATLCFNICGYIHASFSILWYEQCICAGDVIMSNLKPGNCSSQYICPGNSSELCGCINYLTVYQIDYTTFYTVSIIDDAVTYPSGEYYVTLIGGNRECAEVLIRSNTGDAALNCRNVGSFVGIRVGVGSNSSSSIISQVQVKANGLTVLTSNCGNIRLGGHDSRVVDILSNSSCLSPNALSRFFQYSMIDIRPFDLIVCAAENYPCEGDPNDIDTWPQNYYMLFIASYFYRMVTLDILSLTRSAGDISPNVKFAGWVPSTTITFL